MIRERRFSLVAAVAAIATGALACRDTTTPREVSDPGITEPSLTLANGFTSTLVGRGNLGTFHIQSKANGYDVELKSHDNTDIAVANIVVAPGGHSGWHYHPGPVLVVVKTGAITFYHGNDRVRDDKDAGKRSDRNEASRTCSGTRHPAGTVFIEEGGDVGIARNEEAGETTVVATFFVPAGGPTRIDAPAPGNCRLPDLNRIP